MAAEYLVVSKAPATPLEFLVDVCLRGIAEGDEPRSLIRALQPAISDDGLIIFPLAGKFAMLGYVEDVGIFVCPEFPVASNGDNLVDNEETKGELDFQRQMPSSGPAEYWKTFMRRSLTRASAACEYQAQFGSHHSRQFGAFPAGYHHSVRSRERHVLQFLLGVGIRAESLVAVKDANFVGGNSGGPLVS
jgi:hypothetical protein